MSKSRAAEARERKRAKKLEEQQEKEDKKRAAESMLGSFSFAASSVAEMTDGQTDSTDPNPPAKRRKGSSRAGGQPERRTQGNKDGDSHEDDDGAEPDTRLKHAETIIKEYYSTFYEGFKKLVDCCPTVEEQDCRDRKQFTLETAALERFKRNLSRAATRYLLPVLEEQLQDIKDIFPEEEVKALKQKYRHKVPPDAFPTNLDSAEGHLSSHEAPEETPRSPNPSPKENGADKDDSPRDASAVDTSATTDDADHDNAVQQDADHSFSDRESTPDAERLLLGEIQQAASMRKSRPSGVHFEDSAPPSYTAASTCEKDAPDAGATTNEKVAPDGDTNMTSSEKSEASGDQEEEAGAGAGAGTGAGAGAGAGASAGVEQLAECADGEGAATLLRKLGLSRLADTSVRCSISAKTLAEVLDSIPEHALTEALARSSRPSDSSEKSVAETELSASTQDSLDVSHARQAQEAGQGAAAAVVFGPSQRPGAALGVIEHASAGVNQTGALEESEEEEEEPVAACGHCRRCGEGYKLDDPKRIPKLLVCCHTLCSGCARALSECPWCAHPVVKQEALPEDRLEVEKVLSRCDECERGSYAVTACLDCDKRLCHDCNDGHSRVALSCDHRVRELAQAIYVPKQYCVTDGHDHGPFEVYCKTCDTILCSKGFMEDHMVHNHEYSWIQQVSEADRDSLVEHERDVELVLKYRDPRNVRRKVVCGEQDSRHLEKHFDDLVALVQALRTDTMQAFRSKVQQDVAALTELKSVASRPARQAIRYSKAVMIAAAAHSSHAGGVVHHYVLHKTAKDALQRYKESVLDTKQITTSLLLDRQEMKEGSPLRLFRDRLYQMSASCSEIGYRLQSGTVEVEVAQDGDPAQTPADDEVQSPVLEADKAAVPSPQPLATPFGAGKHVQGAAGLPVGLTPGLSSRLAAATTA